MTDYTRTPCIVCLGARPLAWREREQSHAAKDVRDLNLPGLRFEPLKYDRPGSDNIRITDRYRTIFRFKNGDAFGVSIENFHGRKTS